MSAAIGATAALVGVPLNQWLTRRSAERHWHQQRCAEAYEQLITALDRLFNANLRMAQTPDISRPFFDEAARDYARARSLVALYGNPRVDVMLQAVTVEGKRNLEVMGLPLWYTTQSTLLGNVRFKVIEIAREDLGTNKPFPPAKTSAD